MIRADGTVEDLKGGGIILGILPIAKYEDVHATMNPGDMLVLYSDGVTEAATAADDDFPGEARFLGQLAASLRTRPAHEIVAAVQSEVAKFAAGTPQADDITVVVMVRRLSAFAPRAIWAAADEGLCPAAGDWVGYIPPFAALPGGPGIVVDLPPFQHSSGVVSRHPARAVSPDRPHDRSCTAASQGTRGRVVGRRVSR